MRRNAICHHYLTIILLSTTAFSFPGSEPLTPTSLFRGPGRQDEVAEELRPAAGDPAKHRLALGPRARPQTGLPSTIG